MDIKKYFSAKSIILLIILLALILMIVLKVTLEHKALEEKLSRIENSSMYKKIWDNLIFGEGIEKTASDKDITVNYLSSFFDGGAVVLFVEVVDKNQRIFKENGNAKKLNLRAYRSFRNEGSIHKNLNEPFERINNCKVMDYNVANKSAILRIEIIDDIKMGEVIDFKMESINRLPKKLKENSINLLNYKNKITNQFILEENFVSSYLNNRQTEEIKDNILLKAPFEDNDGNAVHLSNGDMQIPIKNILDETLSQITNIGYKDDWCYIQMKPIKNINWEDMTLFLENNETKEVVYPEYYMKFGENLSEEDMWLEYLFKVKNLTDGIVNYTLKIKEDTYEENVKGDWKLAFQINDTTVLKCVANKNIEVNGNKLKINDIKIHPTSINFTCIITEEKELDLNSLNLEALDLQVLYADSTSTKIPNPLKIMANLNSKKVNVRIECSIEDFNQVEGIVLNGTKFNVDK